MLGLLNCGSFNATESGRYLGTAMWKKKENGEFDATVWKGPIDLTTATVRVSVLLGLGLLWLGIGAWIFLGN